MDDDLSELSSDEIDEIIIIMMMLESSMVTDSLVR
jgi:hypothetical protein